MLSGEPSSTHELRATSGSPGGSAHKSVVELRSPAREIAARRARYDAQPCVNNVAVAVVHFMDPFASLRSRM